MSDIVPASVAELLRVPVFLPRLRSPYRDGRGWMENAHGRVRVVGALGQAEADVFEACMDACVVIEEDDSGGLFIEVPVYRARRAITPGGGSGQGFERSLNRLVEAWVELDVARFGLPVGEILSGTLFERWEETGEGARRSFGNPDPRQRRRVIRIWLGSVTLGAYKYTDLPQYRAPRLFHGLGGESKAVARYLMTHNAAKQPNGGWKLDTLLWVVGVDVASRQARNEARRRVRRDKVALGRLGIVLDQKNRVFLRPRSP